MREQRKTVSVLFCDVTGSTALGESIDPEALRGLLARYFDRMRAIVEHHGGIVEKFIGDAIMAVFGVPVAHDDDALRAVRAAQDMRDALPEIGVQARIGVNTGEVVTGTAERLVTGDAVNVAARMEQAAPPGEVLLGDPTLVLVREVVEVEPVHPLALKGKANRVPAHRLLRVRESPERPHGMQFVGRAGELATLHTAWDLARREGRCELVTVIGDAGIGKSRLAAEFLAQLDATIARGRCPPYGEGITYWPVVEVLQQLTVLPEDGTAAASIRSLLGRGEATTSAEEIAWAFRKTVERAAADRPLILVFDDLQWGEETFLDLIEHVALLSNRGPILALCMARPQLTERRPTWPVTVRLDPLDDQEVTELIPEDLGTELRETILRTSGGNPLFVEEILAMVDENDGDVAVPPTLHAALDARLDQLGAGERTVLELGSIEGEVFHRGAVHRLAPDETRVTPLLASLVRRGLIGACPPQLPDEDGFRFRHLLIRDAAYEALPKATRAELHRRLASWLEETGSGLPELDEIVGFHLGEARRYRLELGMPPDDELSAATRRRLTAAGRRAYLRGDHAAAIGLLERASACVPTDEIDLLLETTLCEAEFEAGRSIDAGRRADAIAERAAAAGDRRVELCARIVGGRFHISADPEGATDELTAMLEEALPLFEASADDFLLYVAYYALGWVEAMRGRFDAMVEALEQATVHARAIGSPLHVMGWLADGRLNGTTPIQEILVWLDETEAVEPSSPLLRKARAQALARLGRLDEARDLVASVRAELVDRGADLYLGTVTGIDGVQIELLRNDPIAAVELGEDASELLDRIGEHAFRSTAAGYLAQAYYALGRLSDAEASARQVVELGASDDMTNQMLWRQVEAKVFARRGDHDEAIRLAREAVALGDRTDMLDDRASARLDLAEVLGLAGRPDEAATALEEALALYERKGNVVMAGRVRDRLAMLRHRDLP
ncbi:MAG TPA: adenylate/guanylate cyclase domain-containing protein [Actinomycetota bacterium]|nr:adenylate/guanylate cyclase domain-containing protein [Actinomycetota bacterium]